MPFSNFLSFKASRLNDLESGSSQTPSTASTLSREEASISTLESISTLKSSVSESLYYFNLVRDRLMNLISFLSSASMQNLSLSQLEELWNCLIVNVATSTTSEINDCETASQVGTTGSPHPDTATESYNASYKWFNPHKNPLIRPHASAFFQRNILMIKPELFTPAAIE